MPCSVSTEILQKRKQEQTEQGIRRHLQVEIESAVDADPDEGDRHSEREGAFPSYRRGGESSRRHRSQRASKRSPEGEERGKEQPDAPHAQFGHKLQVLVVRLLDAREARGSVVARIGDAIST